MTNPNVDTYPTRKSRIIAVETEHFKNIHSGEILCEESEWGVGRPVSNLLCFKKQRSLKKQNPSQPKTNRGAYDSIIDSRSCPNSAPCFVVFAKPLEKTQTTISNNEAVTTYLTPSQDAPAPNHQCLKGWLGALELTPAKVWHLQQPCYGHRPGGRL